MTKTTEPTTAQYAILMIELMPAIAAAQRVGLSSLTLIALLQAGRLRADYDEVVKTASTPSERALSFPEYEALRSMAALLEAKDEVHVQICRRRAVLVAMGELGPDHG